MYYPQVNNYLFSIDFTINAKGFKTYANQIQVALNIGPSHLNHSFYINEPAIEGTTINATDIVNEQLTLNETGLTSDVINFSKEWSLINASNYIYTSAMGYESSIVVNDSGQLIITKIPAGNRSIIVQCIVRSQNYLFVPQTIQRTIDFWVEGDFGVYECEETPIVYTYGTTQLYNGGVSIIKTNRLKAIDPNLNAADGYIPKANYEDSLDISMSTPGLSGIIDYDLAERKITISNSINAGTYQLAFKYRYYDGYGSYYPYDYPNYAYEIVTITINRGTIIAPSLKINGTTTSGIAVDYDYSSSSYLLTTTYGDSYTNPNNNSQIDSISTS
jgi:hypothetical protein